MKKLLVIVDMQNDFIDGALGTAEAMTAVPQVIKKVREWKDDIVCTKDTHTRAYLHTNEGRHLPIPHCIEGTRGQEISRRVAEALGDRAVIFEKSTFGCPQLMDYIREQGYDCVEFVGLCADVCLTSDAIMAKTLFPECHIKVDASCCAGVTPEGKRAAFTTMAMCQIDII